MIRNNSFREGLSFGIGMAVFLVVQNLFTNENQTSHERLKSVFSGLIAAVIAGIVFGWLTGLISKSKYFKKPTQKATNSNESL